MEREKDFVENMAARTFESAGIVGKAAEEPAKVVADYVVIFLSSRLPWLSFLRAMYVESVSDDLKRRKRFGIRAAA